MNQELKFQAIHQIGFENDLITIVQSRGARSLEDVIVERAKNEEYFDVQTISCILTQLIRYLTLFEFKRDFHLNLSTTNCICSGACYELFSCE